MTAELLPWIIGTFFISLAPQAVASGVQAGTSHERLHEDMHHDKEQEEHVVYATKTHDTHEKAFSNKLHRGMDEVSIEDLPAKHSKAPKCSSPSENFGKHQKENTRETPTECSHIICWGFPILVFLIPVVIVVKIIKNANGGPSSILTDISVEKV